MKANLAIRAFVVLAFVGCIFQHQNRIEKEPIIITLWYGECQEFGNIGLPQKWINIPGNVTAADGISSLTYKLNQGESNKLTLGSDLHRLAAEGDFNIDLKVADCLEGENHVLIEALDALGNKTSKLLKINVTKQKSWPLPYQIDWSEVNNIQEVVQVVDGQWQITKDGVSNIDVYYDRVLAFGDNSWENYEVFTTVTFHDFTPPIKGPPTYNVSHAAIATRWPGHDADDLQPHRKWFPLGATAEFRLTKDLDSCRWRIFDGPKPDTKNFHVEQSVEEYRNIELNKVYGMKHRVETIGKDSTMYSVKLWPILEQEPAGWDFQGVEEDENVAKGSALLLAHNTKVTFGNIFVTPIKTE